MGVGSPEDDILCEGDAVTVIEGMEVAGDACVGGIADVAETGEEVGSAD